MRKMVFFMLLGIVLALSCAKEERNLYTIGIFQVNEAPHLNQVRNGFINALEENGLVDGENIWLITKNGDNDIAKVQKIALGFVTQKADMIAAFSTPCLQAALHATRDIPIVFSSVANPFLAGAGRSPEDHLPNVTGVSSRGPIKESLAFIKEVMPSAKRIGTLWTPSELNSEFYLNLAKKEAGDLGLEIVEIPIANTSEVLLSAQMLVNKKIDAIYQISDNTINASFQALGKVAEENGIPLFGGFLLSTRMGACAAMGWNFNEVGYDAGRIAVRVINGEDPADIPIQYMKKIRLHLNTGAAEKQGVRFPESVLEHADRILTSEGTSPPGLEDS